MRGKSKGTVYILLAASLWGLFPLFTRLLYALGVDAITSAAVRAYIAALIFLAQILLSGALKTFKLRHLPFYALYGLIAITGTYCLYALTLSMLPTGEAAVLLYTAPAFIILLGRLLFGERVTLVKISALILTFSGCFLVVRGYDPGAFKIDATGIVLGLLSGLCYASLTIFGRYGLKLYPAGINSTLPTICGAMFFLLIRPPWTVAVGGAGAWALFAGLAVVSSVLPYKFYIKGLECGVEGGHAGIMANLEPIIATLVGVAVFADRLEPLQFAGILLTLVGASLPALPISWRRPA